MTRFADLHVHTYFSDSTFSPHEAVACAKEKGLAAIAICDHDCVDGIPICKEAGDVLGVEIIPGIELTVEKSDIEIHILGYFFNWQDEAFCKRLKEIQDSRVGRIHKMIDKLKQHDIEIDPKDVFKHAGKGSVGRLHLARALFMKGKIRSLKEVFDNYIGFLKPCYVSNIRLTPHEAIGMIRNVGGVPVLAHPAIMNRDDIIPELVECGLRGIEAYHTDHNASRTRHYLKLAKEYGLLVTGGSDCHGFGKGKILMGGVKVPYEVVEKLKEEADKIRKNE